MSVVLHPVKHALICQVGKDRLRHFGDVLAGQPAEPLDEIALFVQGRHGRQPKLAAQLEVFCPAAGRDVDDARAFRLANLVPGDHPVGLHGI